MEIFFSLLGRTEILVVDKVEHEFLRSGDDSVMFLMKICQWITCVLILATNVPLIIFIMKVLITFEEKVKELMNTMPMQCAANVQDFPGQIGYTGLWTLSH